MKRNIVNIHLWHKTVLYGAMLLAAITAGLADGQGVIISNSGPPDTTQQFNGVLTVANSLLAASWSATGAYSNVNVAVALKGNSGASGVAYLTTQIGAGTTTNKQIAAANFTFPATSGFFPVFSGLNLTAGTYYLVIRQTTNGSSGNGVWLGTPSPNLITAANVTANGEYSSYNAINSYAPATSFTRVNSTYFDYYVTGVSVPEPSVTGLILLGSGAVIWGRRRNRIGCWR